MSDERVRQVKGHAPEWTVQRKQEFQEVQGEAEADAVRDAFLKGAGVQTSSVAAALSEADSSNRAQAVTRLQEERGNSFVQRVVAEGKGTPGRLVGLSQDEMVGEVLQRKGSGNTLPDVARQPLEQHLGADLSGVRVHADAEAASLSRELEASAFTMGNEIFFAEGRYEPSSSTGQGLLAHEIAHVGQQVGLGPAAQREAAPEENDEAVQRQDSTEEEEEVQA